MEYYQVLLNYLENASYGIDSAEERIDFAVARGRITGTEAEELRAVAVSHATEPPLAEQVTKLRERLAVYAGLIAWQETSAEYVFEAGTLVLSGGVIYRCTADHEKGTLAPPAEDGAHWEPAV